MEVKGIRMSSLGSVNNADTCANPNAIKLAFLGMRSRNTYFRQMSPGSLIGSGAGVGTNHTLENIGSIMVGQRSLLIDGETKGQRCRRAHSRSHSKFMAWPTFLGEELARSGIQSFTLAYWGVSTGQG